MKIEFGNLGEYIRYFRETNKWTQGELAERVGVSLPRISDWETGRAVPDVDNIKKLGAALHTSNATTIVMFRLCGIIE